MKTIDICDKKIKLYNSNDDKAPLIILNTVMDEGESVFNQIKHLTQKDFNFCAIGNLDWNSDMSPWEIAPISKNDVPCKGKADEYLEQLVSKIIPEVRKDPEYIALCGYSLAGLFAIYSLYRTDIFSRIASASGSFWYPNFCKFV